MLEITKVFVVLCLASVRAWEVTDMGNKGGQIGNEKLLGVKKYNTSLDGANPGFSVKYCESVGKVCAWSDEDIVYEEYGPPTAFQCTATCNRMSVCVATYFSKYVNDPGKEGKSVCRFYRTRCGGDGELPLIPDDHGYAEPGTTYIRQKVEETKCGPGSTEYNPPFAGKPLGSIFCRKRGYRCPKMGKNYGSFYLNPQALNPSWLCLRKCLKIKSCVGVDYYWNQDSPNKVKASCDLRSDFCGEGGAENYFDLSVRTQVNPDGSNGTARVKKATDFDTYVRLQEGQNCPCGYSPVVTTAYTHLEEGCPADMYIGE